MTLWKCKVWYGYADKTQDTKFLLVSTDGDEDPFAVAFKHLAAQLFFGKKLEVCEVLEASQIKLPYVLEQP